MVFDYNRLTIVMPYVLLIDDHPSILECLQTIALSQLNASTVGSARSPEQAIAEATKHPWNLIITDVTMPGRAGPELIAELRRLAPDARILVYTVHDEAQFGVRCIRAGAHGYINKDEELSQLVNACKQLLAGRRYIPPRLAELLADSLQQPESLHDTLSHRELEVLRLIAAGKQPSEIARTLHISPKTVGTYRARILDKLSLESTADLVRYAILHNLG